MLGILLATLSRWLSWSFQHLLSLLLLLHYVESGLRHDWLDYSFYGNLHLHSVSEILSDCDALQVLLQLEEPDAEATLLWWTFLGMQRIKSLPCDTLRS